MATANMSLVVIGRPLLKDVCELNEVTDPARENPEDGALGKVRGGSSIAVATGTG